MMKKKEKVYAVQQSPAVRDAITVTSLNSGKDNGTRWKKDSKEPAAAMNGDQKNSMEKQHFVSPVVRARQSSNGDIDGVNRFKYFSAPLSADTGRVVLPLRSSLVPMPLKTAMPVLEEWVEKKQLESLRSSSGYPSTRSSSRAQAISERLYGSRNRSSSCSRCSVDCPQYGHATPKPTSNGIAEFPPVTPASLPDIGVGDVRLLVSANSDRASAPRSDIVSAPKVRRGSRSPPKRGDTASSLARTILINIEREGDTMKQIKEKLARRGEQLRQEIEEQLKHAQLRHERAMRILRDQQRQERQSGSAVSLSIDRPQIIPPIPPRSLPGRPPNGSKGFVRRNRYPKKRSSQLQNGYAVRTTQSNPMTRDALVPGPYAPSAIDSSTDATTCSACSQSRSSSNDPHPQSVVDVGLVDSPLVENNIIKPLVDAVLRESVAVLSVSRANETLAFGTSETVAVYDDAEQFLYDEVIPTAVEVAAFTASSA